MSFSRMIRSPVRILINKTASQKDNTILSLVDYQNELSRTASSFKGFISSSSFIHADFPSLDNKPICNISLWEHHNDWSTWLNSDERANIKIKYEDILENEEFKILTTRYDFYDIPLL